MRSSRKLLEVAVATPVLFLSVAVGLRWLAVASGQADVPAYVPPPWASLGSGVEPTDAFRFVVVFDVPGGIVVGAWDHGVYAPGVITAAFVAATTVVAAPGFYHYGTPGTLVLVAALLVGATEWTARNRAAARQLLADEDVHSGFALELLHVAFAVAAAAVEGLLGPLVRPVVLPVLKCFRQVRD